MGVRALFYGLRPVDAKIFLTVPTLICELLG